MNGDEIFLREACRAALTQSQDRHTQNGALLRAVTGEIVTAANRFPPNVMLTAERLQRPLKYEFIEHAERGVIFAAASAGICTHRATLYCPWFACADCARAIICAGITEVVGLAYPEPHGRWKDSVLRGDEMLREAGIVCRRIVNKLGIKILRDEQEVEI